MDVVSITHARVPVIHFTDRLSRRSCDLVVHSPLGLHNSRMIKTYLKFDRTGKVRVFFMLLKRFAKINHLNKASEGSLSSYAWTVLGFHILFKLKLIPNFQSPPPDTRAAPELCEGILISYSVPTDSTAIAQYERNMSQISLSHLLLVFFEYFTEEFDVVRSVATMRGFGEVCTNSFSLYIICGSLMS